MIISLRVPNGTAPDLTQTFNDIEDALNNDQLGVYPVSNLPPANVDGKLIFVPDASAGPSLAVSWQGEWLAIPTSGVIS